MINITKCLIFLLSLGSLYLLNFKSSSTETQHNHYLIMGTVKIAKYFQVDEVLSMECDKELEEGKNPGPMVEIEFWEAKCRNLESLYEQVMHQVYAFSY